MEFVHYFPGSQETIAALATPPGEGGIAIIRISGKEAIPVAERIFSGPVRDYASHTAHLGFVHDKKKEMIDQALLLVMRSPRSYTGEDTVEIQCHGGTVAARKILEAAIESGARLASPGEFTFKAFLNGKLDLAQAEAVQKLIGAKSEAAFHHAQSHLQGKLSKRVKTWQKQLISIAAELEAAVDFVEEAIELSHRRDLQQQLNRLQNEMQHVLETFQDGRKIAHGIKVCIAGPPNAGKSSLLNALLERERAIVSPVAGTTRDLVEAEMNMNGYALTLTDTAGIRESEDSVEKEGVRRTYQAMEEADIILLVLDAGKEMDSASNQLLEEADPQKTILVWNKIDLPHPFIRTCRIPSMTQLSVENRIGFEQLRNQVDQMLSALPASKEEVMISSLRHFEALSKAHTGCRSALAGMQHSFSEELIAFELRQALTELGRIIGNDISKEILTSIFSQFCIGK